jgi:PIN domain nuclease of toxin-antitoxin system
VTRVLLDSNAVVRWITGQRFDKAARRVVDRSPTFVSAVSVWELGQKLAAGRLRIPWPLGDELDRHELERLSFTAEHAERVVQLPLLHGDPMDRMLIAQAQVERLTIVTRDEVFERYEVDVLRC